MKINKARLLEKIEEMKKKKAIALVSEDEDEEGGGKVSMRLGCVPLRFDSACSRLLLHRVARRRVDPRKVDRRTPLPTRR